MNEVLFYDLKQVPVPVVNLATQIAGDLGRLIVGAHYAPGGMLEDEANLAKRYQVSRSVIRDAIKILVGKGLLEVRRGAGTRVKPREYWGLLDNDVLAWSQSAPPDPRTIRNLYGIRCVFEPKAAKWAAERGSTEAINKIGQALQAMQTSRNTVEGFVMADANFHRTILQASENEFMVAMEGVIFSALLSSIRLTNADPRDNEVTIPLHADVFDAIRAHDGKAAEMAMEAILDDAGTRLEHWLAGPANETRH